MLAMFRLNSFALSTAYSVVVIVVSVYFMINGYHKDAYSLTYLIWSCILTSVLLLNFFIIMLRKHVMQFLIGYAGAASCAILIFRYIYRFVTGEEFA